MRNKGLRLAIVIAAIYAMFAGFISSLILEETTLPGSSQILVSGSTVSTGGQGLPAITQQIADASDAVVIKQVRDLNETNARNLYIAAGNMDADEAAWLAEGYPAFSQNVVTKVHPANDLQGSDPRGRYFVYGPETAVQSATTEFERLGYTTERLSMSTSQNLGIFFQGLLGAPTLITLLLIVLLAGISAISQMKDYAVQRLHGISKSSAIWHDFRSLLPSAPMAVAALACAGTAWLYFYNGLNQVGRLVQTTSIVFAVAAAFILIVHVVAVSIVWNSSIVQGLKGRLGFRVAIPVAYLIRIPGILLAITLAASSFAAVASTQDAASAKEEFKHAGPAAQIVFEGHMSAEEMDKFAYASGAWLKQEDKAGRAILAARHQLDASEDNGSHEVLLVNNSYLRENTIVDTSGKAVEEIPDDQVRVLVPEEHPVEERAVENFLEEFLLGTGSLPQTAFGVIKNDQRHFLYEDRPIPPAQPQWLEEPIVIVVGSDSGLIRDDDYMAMASNGQVLMADAESAILHTPPEFMGTWIAAYIPVAQLAADNYGDQISELKVKVASSLVALLVLLATAVGLAQMHVRGNAQSILIRYLHGWRFYSIHRWLIRAELAVLAVVAMWALIRWILLLSSKSSFASESINHSAFAIAYWQPWAILFVAVLNLGLLLSLVRVRTIQMIRTHSEETA